MDERKPELDNQDQDPEERWEDALVKGSQEGLRRRKAREGESPSPPHPSPQPKE